MTGASEQQPRQDTSERENIPSSVVSPSQMPSSSVTASAMRSAPLTKHAVPLQSMMRYFPTGWKRNWE